MIQHFSRLLIVAVAVSFLVLSGCDSVLSEQVRKRGELEGAWVATESGQEFRFHPGGVFEEPDLRLQGKKGTRFEGRWRLLDESTLVVERHIAELPSGDMLDVRDLELAAPVTYQMTVQDGRLELSQNDEEVVVYSKREGYEPPPSLVKKQKKT